MDGERSAAHDDWVSRARETDSTLTSSVTVDRASIVIVAAPMAAVAGDVALQVGIGDAERPVCLVATEAAPTNVQSYLAERVPTQPPLGFVDATPHRPTPAMKDGIQALEDVPGATDLLQLTTAVGDVRASIAPDDRPTNIVIPQFDALLGGAPTDRVVRVLSHIAETDDDAGTVVIGLDYTAGSSETLQTLHAQSDVLLWAERNADGTVTVDFESTRR